MSGGLAHSACEDNLQYWKMRIVDYFKRTRKCFILNAVAWPAELLIEITYPLAAASGAPLHEGTLHLCDPCVCPGLWSLTAITSSFSMFPFSLATYLIFHVYSKATPPCLFLILRSRCLFMCDFFLYENVHTKYPLLLCRWPSWNVRIYASDKFGIQIQTFWVYSTALIFWLISLSCDFALSSAETFAVLTYRL